MASVLVVDDSTFMRHWLRRELEAAGHEVVAEAASCEEADAHHADLAPDLTVLDLFLPGPGGLGLLERLMHRDADSRVVAYAEPWQEEDAVRAVRGGARDVLVKPLEALPFGDALAAALL